MHMALLQALIIIGLLLASMSMVVVVRAEELANPSGSGNGIEPIHVDVDADASGREQLIGPSENVEDDSVKAVHSHDQYLVKLEIGGDSFLVVPDTGSDLVWTNSKHKNPFCNRAVVCPGTDASVVCDHCSGGLCTFERSFGNGVKTATGYIARGALTLLHGKTTSTTDGINVYLGCASYEDDHLLPESADGIVGLNRGPMSLVRQLHANSFSYCLGNKLKPDLPGRLWLGDDKKRSYSMQMQTTPLVQHVEREEDQHSTSVLAKHMYYLQLDGISIGANSKYRWLPKRHFNLKSKNDKDKGVIFLDSGCSRTILEKGVFEALEELLEQEPGVKKDGPKIKDHLETTCFRAGAAASGSRPELVLYFPNGAEMHLPWANYIKERKADKGLFCLAIYKSTTSILGNFQQQNVLMRYDLTQGKEELSFQQEVDCGNFNF